MTNKIPPFPLRRVMFKLILERNLKHRLGKGATKTFTQFNKAVYLAREKASQDTERILKVYSQVFLSVTIDTEHYPVTLEYKCQRTRDRKMSQNSL